MSPRPHRVTTAIRFEPTVHEVLRETADELGVGVNWLVNKLCEEGLERIDLTNFSLVRPRVLAPATTDRAPAMPGQEGREA